MAKEKKVETKTQKIVNYVIMAIEIIIIVIGIIFSIIMISGQKTDPTKGLGNGTNVTAVLSDSMDSENEIFKQYKIGSFKIGDVLLIKNIASNAEAQAELKEGDVLTYLGVGPTGEYGLISHRIYKIKTIEVSGETTRLYYTLGDKQYTGYAEIDDFNAKEVQGGSIQGIVTGKISKIGYAIIWLQDSTHFLLVVVLPLALLLIYNVYLLIRLVVDYKIKRLKEQNEMVVAAIKAESPVDEEEIKRKAIEEYLAQKKEQEPKDEKLEDTSEVQDEKPKD